MPFYRKRPVVVEAVRFGVGEDPPGVFRDSERKPYVVTIHGERAYVAYGDWVITEPGGGYHYPCKHEIFAATYEAEPASQAIRSEVYTPLKVLELAAPIAGGILARGEGPSSATDGDRQEIADRSADIARRILAKGTR